LSLHVPDGVRIGGGKNRGKPSVPNILALLGAWKSALSGCRGTGVCPGEGGTAVGPSNVSRRRKLVRRKIHGRRPELEENYGLRKVGMSKGTAGVHVQIPEGGNRRGHRKKKGGSRGEGLTDQWDRRHV